MSDLCGCGCEGTVITALEGPAGSDGTTTGVVTGGFSTSASTLEYVYTTNRASTSANALDYDWSIITIPAVSASNVAIFDVMFQINATDVHNVTMTVLETLSGAPVAGISFVQNCGTREMMSARFEVANVTQGQIYALHLVSSDPAVSPSLRGGNARIDIYC